MATDAEPEPEPEIFNISVVAAAAQLDVHPHTLKRWASKGAIRHFRTQGGHYRFSQAALDDFRSARVAGGAEVAS